MQQKVLAKSLSELQRNATGQLADLASEVASLAALLAAKVCKSLAPCCLHHVCYPRHACLPTFPFTHCRSLSLMCRRRLSRTSQPSSCQPVWTCS